MLNFFTHFFFNLDDVSLYKATDTPVLVSWWHFISVTKPEQATFFIHVSVDVLPSLRFICLPLGNQYGSQDVLFHITVKILCWGPNWDLSCCCSQCETNQADTLTHWGILAWLIRSNNVYNLHITLIIIKGKWYCKNYFVLG